MKIYLIGISHKDEELTKIGIAFNPSERLKILDSPLLPFAPRLLAEYEAGENAAEIEKGLHTLYRFKHVRGEWFRNIERTEFMQYAKLLHEQRLMPWKPQPSKDPHLTWLEEQAFGNRMLTFITSLEMTHAPQV